MVQTLDDTDLRILRLVQQDCRITNKDLAAQIHLSTTPTFERLKRLERMGFITRYVAVLDAMKLDRGFQVMCNISMKQINSRVAEDFKNEVLAWNEVAECYNVSGDCDYMMKVFVPSMAAYQKFIIDKVGSLDYTGQTHHMSGRGNR